MQWERHNLDLEDLSKEKALDVKEGQDSARWKLWEETSRQREELHKDPEWGKGLVGSKNQENEAGNVTWVWWARGRRDSAEVGKEGQKQVVQDRVGRDEDFSEASEGF